MRGVGDRVVHRLVHEADVAALLAISVSAAVMLPPTESPATASRSGSSPLAAPSRMIHWAVA